MAKTKGQETDTKLNPTVAVKGAIRQIPFEDILPPDDGIPATKTLIHLITTWGLVHPLILQPVGDKFKIIAGRRRWDAIRQIRANGLTMKVPARLTNADFDANSTLALTILENHSRQDNPLADAMAIKELRLNGVSAEEIAKQTGLMKAQQELRLSLLNLLPSLIEHLQKGTLGVSLAEKIAHLPKDGQEKVVAIAEERWELTPNKPKKFITQDYRQSRLARRISAATELFAGAKDNLATGIVGEGQFINEEEAADKADASLPGWVLRSKQELTIVRLLLKRIENQDTVNQCLDGLELLIDETAAAEGMKV